MNMSLFKFTPGREMGKVSTMLTRVTTYEKKKVFPFYLFLFFWCYEDFR